MRSRLLLALPLALASPVLLAAQAPVPRLRAMEEMRIDGAEAGFTAVRHILVQPNGGIAVTDLDDPRVRYFTAEGRPAGVFGRKGSGPGEFNQVVHAGMLGDTLWAADLSLSRVTRIGSDRQLIRSYPLPRRVAPPRADTRGESHEAIFLLEALSGDVFLGPAIPMPNAWPSWLPRIGQGSPLVSVDPDGHLRRVVGWRSRTPECSEPWDAGALRGTVPVPFCASGKLAYSQNGQWLAFIEQRNAVGTSADFRLAVVRSDGDSVFSVTMPYRPIEVDAEAADSALAKLRGFSGGLTPGGLPQQAMAAVDRIKVPATHAPVHAVIAGPDGTVWLGLERGEPAYTWLGLLPNGSTLGELTLPRNVRVVNATATQLWGIETDDDGVPSVVRYRVVR